MALISSFARNAISQGLKSKFLTEKIMLNPETTRLVFQKGENLITKDITHSNGSYKAVKYKVPLNGDISNGTKLKIVSKENNNSFSFIKVCNITQGKITEWLKERFFYSAVI